MQDVLLKNFFEYQRWEKAIGKGVCKDMDKSLLINLTAPEFRVNIYSAIINNSYRITPPHIALIPKDTPGEYREVLINEDIDRIFCSIVNDMFFEKYSHFVHQNCKSYQEGIGCGAIVKEVVSIIQDIGSNCIGYKLDLSKYFDSVKIEYIDSIFDRIESIDGKSKIIDIVRDYYHNDMLFDENDNLIEVYKSLKQGCAISAFLADAVLYNVDVEISKMNNIYYVRYSDDILILGEEEDTQMAFEKISKMLAEMGMSLNPKKIEKLRKDRWFKFLGFNIKDNQITLSKSRVKTFQKEIEQRTIKANTTYTKAINSVNRYLYKGDGTYSWATSVLSVINVDKDIQVLNAFVMDCLRAVKTGKKKLGGLGVVNDKDDYTILRGTGRNVRANRENTDKDIPGYNTIRCMRNALLTRRAVYDTLVRQM